MPCRRLLFVRGLPERGRNCPVWVSPSSEFSIQPLKSASTTSAQVIYGHVIHQNSGSDDGKQCVSAVDAAFGDDDDDDDNGDVGFNGSKLALQDCVYDMESSVHLGQYWRILLIYSYPVVSLVTSSK